MSFYANYAFCGFWYFNPAKGLLGCAATLCAASGYLKIEGDKIGI